MVQDSRWPPNLIYETNSINHLEGAHGFDTSDYLQKYLGSENFMKLLQFHGLVGKHFKEQVRPDLVTCLRNLQAEKWNEGSALERLQATMEWRSTVGADRFLLCPPYGATSKRYSCARICMSVGHDREGDLLLFDRMGPLFASGSVKAFGLEEWFLLYAWNVERWLQEMKSLSVKWKRPLWKYTLIGDATGAGMNVLSHTSLISYINKHSSAHYPELAGRIIIINAPRVFVAVWRVICTIIDPVTASKVEIYSGIPTKRLLEIIEKDQLPCELGGDNGIFIPPQCKYEDLPPLSSKDPEPAKDVSNEGKFQEIRGQIGKDFSSGSPDKFAKKISSLDIGPTVASGVFCFVLLVAELSLARNSFNLTTTGVAMGFLSIVLITNHCTKVSSEVRHYARSICNEVGHNAMQAPESKKLELCEVSYGDHCKTPDEVEQISNHASHVLPLAEKNQYSDDTERSHGPFGSLFVCCSSR